MKLAIVGGIAGFGFLLLFYSVSLGLLTFIGILVGVIFELWQDLLRAEGRANSFSTQATDALRKETTQKAELASIATIQKEANALIQQSKLDHKKEKDSLLEKISSLEKNLATASTKDSEVKELSQQLSAALKNVEQLKQQQQEEQSKAKERLTSLEQQLREALAKEDTHKTELERVLVLAIQEKKAVSEAKDDLIDKQYQALEALAKEKDKILSDSLNERQEVIAVAIRERNVIEGQKAELEKIVHSLQADSGDTSGTGAAASPLHQSE